MKTGEQLNASRRLIEDQEEEIKVNSLNFFNLIRTFFP